LPPLGTESMCEEDGRKRGVGAVTASENVAGGVDPGTEPGGLHQAHHELAPLHVRFRVAEARDAVAERSARGPAERAERLEVGAQPRAIDAQPPVVEPAAEPGAGGGGRQPLHEFPACRHGESLCWPWTRVQHVKEA